MIKPFIKLNANPKAYIAGMLFVILAFILSAYFYRSSAHKDAIKNLQNEITITARSQAQTLKSELQKFSLLPLALSENPYVYDALQKATNQRVLKLNQKLALLADTSGAAYIYVISTNGNTIASSNYDKTDSFVGRQYTFRPYFQRAIEKGSATYFAKGERTGKAGLFLSSRIDNNEQQLGVIVVKVEFEKIIKLWREIDSTTLITNKEGVILFSNDSSLNYRTLNPLSEARRQEILESLQFGEELLQSAHIQLNMDLTGKDGSGNNIVVAVQDIFELGWRAFVIKNTAPTLKAENLRIQLNLLSSAVVLIGLSLFIAWRINRDHQRRQMTIFLEKEVSKKTKELAESNKQLENEMNERAQINKRFRIAREDLAQANRLGSIGAITASIAHEINQPVAAIRAFSENAIKLIDRKKIKSANENLTSIVDLTTKISTITNELRRYARRGSLEIGKVSINQVLEGVELLIGERVRAAGINFKIVGAERTWPSVKGGRVRLEQVLVNLIQNAMEAVVDISKPRIEMLVSSDSKFVYITISDNGAGIEDNIKTKIFMPFFSKKPKGLGIGLGIAKDIMTEFGGTIETFPSKSGGAAFKLSCKRYE